MIAGTVLVTAVLVLAMQVMDGAASGARPSITIASEFGISPDRTFTDWGPVQQAVHGLLNDVPFWFLLVLMAAVLYWLTDWTDEKLTLLFGRAPPPAAEPESLSDASPEPLPHPSEMPR